MNQINFARVIRGGLVAGVVIGLSELLSTAVVLKSDSEAAMKAGGRLGVWIVFAFALGIAAVWLYAAIRPRYGAGAGTAARAGIAVWFLNNLLPTVALANIGLFGGNIPIAKTIWTLAENILAAILGAYFYREDAAAEMNS